MSELAAIGRDEAVIAETARQAREIAEAEVHRLEAERVALENALKGLEGQMREAANGAPSGPQALRLADLQAEAAETRARMSAIQKDLEAARAAHLDDADLRRALGEFDSLWEAMTPGERARTLHAVVERISYDGVRGEVAITFRPTGIKALAGEPHP